MRLRFSALRLPKAGEPQRSLVEGEGRQTSRFGTEGANQRIGKRAAPFFRGDHHGEDFLLTFDDNHIGLQDSFDRRGDIAIGQPVGAFESPSRFRQRNHAEKTGIPLAETVLDDLRRLRR